MYVGAGNWIREAEVDEMREARMIGLVREKSGVLFLNLSYNYI